MRVKIFLPFRYVDRKTTGSKCGRSGLKCGTRRIPRECASYDVFGYSDLYVPIVIMPFVFLTGNARTKKDYSLRAGSSIFSIVLSHSILSPLVATTLKE